MCMSPKAVALVRNAIKLVPRTLAGPALDVRSLAAHLRALASVGEREFVQ